MRRFAVLLAVVATTCFCAKSDADWGVADSGMWPDDWPEELEPLRNHARTLNGGLANLTFYEIPFKSREQFEAAWPHILKIKTEGVPITLFRGPHEFLGRVNAGVRIWHPSYRTRNIWLIVDGDIVDLNRIQLPPDTRIIDNRFEESDSN